MRPVLYNYYSLKITYNKDINQYQQDGLPNITGSINISNQWYDGSSGAFTHSYGGGSNRCGDGGSYPHRTVYDFNASRSSRIYGTSNYVQPKNVSMLPILKY